MSNGIICMIISYLDRNNLEAMTTLLGVIVGRQLAGVACQEEIRPRWPQRTRFCLFRHPSVVYAPANLHRGPGRGARAEADHTGSARRARVATTTCARARTGSLPAHLSADVIHCDRPR